MIRKKWVSVFALMSAMFSLGIIPTATADTNSNENLTDIVDQYGTQIQDSYQKSQNKFFRRTVLTQQQQLARENGIGIYEQSDTPLVVQNASVSTHIISSQRTSQGYLITADITTSLNQVPKDGVTITLGNKKQDHLESIITNRHQLTLVQSNGGYSVASDQVVFDDDDQVEPLQTTIPQGDLLSTSRSRAIPQSTSLASTKPAFDYLKAVEYAELWTDSNHVYKGSNQDFMNVKYPIFNDNCTNFVSQALYEGGLPAKNATVFTRSHDDVWSYMGFAQFGATYTWGGAENNYRYMRYHSGAFDAEDNVKHIGPGGLIYADWDGNGSMDHAVIVTGNIVIRDKTGKPVDAEPIICQKTRNHHDEPLTILTEYANKTYPGKTKWHGLQVRF